MFSIVYTFLYPPLLSVFEETRAQICQGTSQYNQCSSNTACACLPLINTVNEGVCAYLHVKCSELISCANDNRTCYRPGHLCVNHSRWHSAPICYPMDMTLQMFCPPVPSMTTGGNGDGSGLNQFSWPYGLFADADASVSVADYYNDRVVKWGSGASTGEVAAGGNGKGNQTNQLNGAASITYDTKNTTRFLNFALTKVVINKNGTMFICDHNNKRVQRWFKNDTHGQTIIANISCWGLAMGDEGSLYVSDNEHRVTKWPSGQTVAGGHGQGPALNQLGQPIHLFVDENQSVFVADALHNRVMQWPLGAKEGILVAGANEVESSVDYLSSR
ncbi:unnamed protein product [Rotaria socialis]|uniref:Uncharacterized protein n=2 Tax=Rotaria socialis TaxID=392032 RepID=A0A818NZ93_9BILA|nr:unnamed protein product [Rotaria socialis]